MVTKECSNCLETYPRDFFYQNGTRLHSYCKACFTDRVLANKRKRRSHYTQLENKRRLQRKGATPVLTPAEQKDLSDIYDLADQMRSLGMSVQVDHTDPILSKAVCGLHTPANLRILPTRENIQKSNKFEPYGVDAEGNIYAIS